ncbi:MAG: histidinol dehydrogenase [Bacteroidales bacterium]|nr:histidinol dehydrogenase [Bacteroidales bacterium]MCI2121825.1 histidinol dehydrogenase [Bacteroidales bacterium]MCI2146056.1 histidinol dehydrogenase [Bacteroidales bacterium]
MKTYFNPMPSEWKTICERATSDAGDIRRKVTGILSSVRIKGDYALKEISMSVDGVDLDSFEVTGDEIREASAAVPERLKRAIGIAAENIRKFHEAQKCGEIVVETVPGVRCIQREVPIGRVGLYIPGGTAPLFSTVLMLAIPAKVAGCPMVELCTPCGKDGRVNDAVLYAASLCGVRKIYKIGGAQAIAAMAYGTESVPKVDKIFGPGNRYVMEAKRLVSMESVSIDMLAGPSEVMVLADGTSIPEYVAADLLSQAEHGRDSQVMLVCDSAEVAEKVGACIENGKAALKRSDAVSGALDNSRIVVLPERGEMLNFANFYAPEHLILALADPYGAAERITCAGSVFLGNYSCESAGDYASGTNHTLPTSGWARSFSGVNVDSFCRKMTVQDLTVDGLRSLSDTIIAMAEAEGLDAHANAVRVRLAGKK